MFFTIGLRQCFSGRRGEQGRTLPDSSGGGELMLAALDVCSHVMGGEKVCVIDISSMTQLREGRPRKVTGLNTHTMTQQCYRGGCAWCGSY